MLAYWSDFTKLLLPGLFLMLPSAVPSLIGTSFAIRDLRQVKSSGFVKNIWASTAAGTVALGLLFGSLYGNDSSSSSTAGLIFLFVPIYSAVALGLGYGLGVFASRKLAGEAAAAGVAPQISTGYRRLIWVPVAISSALLFGMFRYSIANNDLTVAERASNPDTLHYVYAKSLRGQADSFGVPLYLGQNPDTPADILTDLAKHEHSSVRIFVARHPNTPVDVLESLRNDCDELIRKTVEERLRGSSRSGVSLSGQPRCTSARRKY